MAGEEPAGHPALHPDRLLLAQPRRMLLLDHHPPGHPPRLVHLSPPATGHHRRVHRPLERPPRPFTWTKDADEILASINRAKTKASALTKPLAAFNTIA